MSIKATFPTGVTEVTVNGLHQWDYGQILEIQCDDLPAINEVHFAYKGLEEAIVRVCSASAGRASVVIPDSCIEQASPVVAWACEVGATSGRTMLTIILPVEARTRPADAPTVPEFISDKYTELVAAINAQVESLKQGDVIVAKAKDADAALLAASAAHATNADVAAFASADKSKGTIEARLTSLGFKRGAFVVDGDFGSVTPTINTNAITKRGRYAIGNLYLSYIFSAVSKITLTVPADFRPAAHTPLNACFHNTATGAKSYAAAALGTDGKIQIAIPSGLTSGIVELTNFGWELADYIIYPTIHFTISGRDYYAEPGMTWTEWVASPYNSEGYQVLNGIVCDSSGTKLEYSDDVGDYLEADGTVGEDDEFTTRPTDPPAPKGYTVKLLGVFDPDEEIAHIRYSLDGGETYTESYAASGEDVVLYNVTEIMFERTDYGVYAFDGVWYNHSGDEEDDEGEECDMSVNYTINEDTYFFFYFSPY